MWPPGATGTQRASFVSCLLAVVSARCSVGILGFSPSDEAALRTVAQSHLLSVTALNASEQAAQCSAVVVSDPGADSGALGFADLVPLVRENRVSLLLLGGRQGVASARRAFGLPWTERALAPERPSDVLTPTHALNARIELASPPLSLRYLAMLPVLVLNETNPGFVPLLGGTARDGEQRATFAGYSRVRAGWMGYVGAQPSVIAAYSQLGEAFGKLLALLVISSSYPTALRPRNTIASALSAWEDPAPARCSVQSSDPSMVLRYSFDDGLQPAVLDHGGGAVLNHGVILGDAMLVDDGDAGRGTVLRAVGNSSSMLSIQEPAKQFDFDAGFTLALWVKWVGGLGGRALLGLGSCCEERAGITLSLLPGGRLRFWGAQVNSTYNFNLQSRGSLTPGQWHFVAIRAGSVLEMIVDYEVVEASLFVPLPSVGSTVFAPEGASSSHGPQRAPQLGGAGINNVTGAEVLLDDVSTFSRWLSFQELRQSVSTARWPLQPDKPTPLGRGPPAVSCFTCPLGWAHSTPLAQCDHACAKTGYPIAACSDPCPLLAAASTPWTAPQPFPPLEPVYTAGSDRSHPSLNLTGRLASVNLPLPKDARSRPRTDVVVVVVAQGLDILADGDKLLAAPSHGRSRYAAVFALRLPRAAAGSVNVTGDSVLLGAPSPLTDGSGVVQARVSATWGDGSPCITCSADSVGGDELGLPCAYCPPGMQQDGDRCSPCPLGTAKSSHGGYCEPCSRGMFAPEPGAAACTPCPFGTYSTQVGAVRCQWCPDGTTTWRVGVSNTSECVSCENPAAIPSSEGGCVQCPVGTVLAQRAWTEDTWLEGNHTICDPCPPGTHGEANGTLSCVLCENGTANAIPGAPLCPPCLPGTIAQFRGQTICTSCPEGKSSREGSAMCNQCPPGKYSEDGKTNKVCSSCPVGKHRKQPDLRSSCAKCEPEDGVAPVEGASSCSKCLAPYYRGNSSIRCELCPANRAVLRSAASDEEKTAAQEQATSCNVECEAGERPGPTRFQCVDCDRGTYQTNVGQAECRPCPPGTFENDRGSTRCESCPFGTYMSNEGEDVGCTQCPNERITLQERSTNVSSCVCPSGFYSTDVEFFTAPCKPCPEGGVCEPGELPRAAVGFWYSAGAFDLFYPCQPFEACRGGTLSSSTGEEGTVMQDCLLALSGVRNATPPACSAPSSQKLCSLGFSGPRCATCQDGWFRYTSSCRQCATSVGPLVGLFALGVLCVGAAAFLVQKSGINLAAITIALEFFQVLGRFGRMDLAWSSAPQQTMETASVSDLDPEFIAPECIATAIDYVFQWMVLFLLPIAVAGGLAVVHLGSVLAARLRKRHSGREVRFQARKRAGALFLVLQVLYLTLITKAVQAIDCSSLPDSTQVLDVTPNVVCWTGSHWLLVGFGVLSILLYGAGIPTLFFFVLRHTRRKAKAIDRHLLELESQVQQAEELRDHILDTAWQARRDALQRRAQCIEAGTPPNELDVRIALRNPEEHPMAKEVEEKLKALAKEYDEAIDELKMLDALAGSLYKRFKIPNSFWILLQMLRKAAIVAAFVFLTNRPMIQSTLVALVLTCALYLQLSVLPYVPFERQSSFADFYGGIVDEEHQPGHSVDEEARKSARHAHALVLHQRGRVKERKAFAVPVAGKRDVESDSHSRTRLLRQSQRTWRSAHLAAETCEVKPESGSTLPPSVSQRDVKSARWLSRAVQRRAAHDHQADRRLREQVVARHQSWHPAHSRHSALGSQLGKAMGGVPSSRSGRASQSEGHVGAPILEAASAAPKERQRQQPRRNIKMPSDRASDGHEVKDAACHIAAGKAAGGTERAPVPPTESAQRRHSWSARRERRGAVEAGRDRRWRSEKQLAAARSSSSIAAGTAGPQEGHAASEAARGASPPEPSAGSDAEHKDNQQQPDAKVAGRDVATRKRWHAHVVAGSAIAPDQVLEGEDRCDSAVPAGRDHLRRWRFSSGLAEGRAESSRQRVRAPRRFLGLPIHAGAGMELKEMSHVASQLRPPVQHRGAGEPNSHPSPGRADAPPLVAKDLALEPPEQGSAKGLSSVLNRVRSIRLMRPSTSSRIPQRAGGIDALNSRRVLPTARSGPRKGYFKAAAAKTPLRRGSLFEEATPRRGSVAREAPSVSDIVQKARESAAMKARHRRLNVFRTLLAGAWSFLVDGLVADPNAMEAASLFGSLLIVICGQLYRAGKIEREGREELVAAAVTGVDGEASSSAQAAQGLSSSLLLDQRMLDPMIMTVITVTSTYMILLVLMPAIKTYIRGTSALYGRIRAKGISGIFARGPAKGDSDEGGKGEGESNGSRPLPTPSRSAVLSSQSLCRTIICPSAVDRRGYNGLQLLIHCSSYDPRVDGPRLTTAAALLDSMHSLAGRRCARAGFPFRSRVQSGSRLLAHGCVPSPS